MRLMPLARMKAAAAARLCSCSRSSWPSMSISWRMLRPPGGMSNSGMTMFSRSSDTSTDAVDSMLSLTHLIAVQVPAKRDRRVAVEPVVDHLLHAGRVEDRDHRVDEQEFGGMRDGRGFGHVVVAHQGQHAAMPRRSGEIGVAEDVAGAVDAGTLAVPDREHAVVLAFAEQFGLLRAPAGGRRQLLVEARLEDDVRLRRACFLAFHSCRSSPPSGEPR